jgi:CheY-like chemotaxis protein
MPAKIHPLTENLNWTGKTAIVLEDDFVSFKIIEKYLLPTQIRLMWARNANEALRFCESVRPDIALVDIRLPGINGIEFTRLLKEREDSIPVIIQTAYGMTESRRECQTAGCDDFLAKPYGQNLLLWKMMGYLN